MPRGINLENPTMTIRLDQERKQKLLNLASKYSCDTISRLLAQIADGRLVIIDKVASVLLDRIIEEERAKGKRI